MCHPGYLVLSDFLQILQIQVSFSLLDVHHDGSLQARIPCFLFGIFDKAIKERVSKALLPRK